MQIDPAKQERVDNYKLLVGSILPRPIAFVTSVAEDGTVNASPFSFFTVVSTDPPMISVSVGRKPGGVQKDTARNIAHAKEFVIQVVDGENVEQVNQTATEFPPDVSEVEAVGMDLLSSVKVKVPRIAQSKVQMECRLHEILPIGGDGSSPNTDLIIGEVVFFHVQDDLYDQGRILTEKLDPVGRLAGTTFSTIGETFSMPRLSPEEWKEKYGQS
ncbi:NADH-FMN oxidoreductase RutF, flavin reductase (DIM6/NTAB) family [Marininema mesophilum]|uniref:NADH-FMN oxidoreductase RutF, flavin reductase (DIM6/NTAB) family n=1 Tax=Marininema mesophilum TaxID=1048340 RepID=A0A1H2SD10_9BACL|nr:flavin reductase family protein [Marininema mesophilum]SDW29398.1 NADH-FMN oxidoreductase RutF, flavin reductase (DIM6/NTAB) family [Marininema mesophilum]